MATLEQYEFFKEQFLDEEKRYDSLTKKAEIFLSLLSLFFTGLIFGLKDLQELLAKMPNKTIAVSILAGAVPFFVLAVYCIIRSLRVQSFEAVMDLSTYYEELGDEPMTNEDFFDKRIVDYVEATLTNEKVNDSRADQLRYSLVCISIGFIFIIGFVTYVLLSSIQSHG